MYARTNRRYNERRLCASLERITAIYIYIYIFQCMLERTGAIKNVGCGPTWNGLPLNTNITVYAITNRCYNERRLWASLERINPKYIYFNVR